MSFEAAPGSNYKVKQLTPDEVMDKVMTLVPLLAPSFARAAGEIDVWSALKECALGNMQCFVGDNNGVIIAAMITFFCDYPLKRVCDVVGYAGRARDFYWFNEILEDWAMDNGAVEMRGFGHEATMRLARKHGYEEAYRVYIKPLKRKEK